MAYTRTPNTVIAGQGLKQNPAPVPLAPAGALPVVLDADVATTTNLGVVQIGAGLAITPEGILSTDGQVGFTGSAGEHGFTGSTGSVGSVGFTGSTGFTGSAGEHGFTGSIGYTGSSGFTGSAGSNGSTGSTGFVGSIGFVGSRGFTGSAGFNGSNGFNGSSGYNGSTGFVGSAGFIGSLGYTGSSGTSGSTVGTWTPAITSSALATITVVATTANYSKIGQQVTCYFDITIAVETGGSPFGAVFLSNLPFTSIASTGYVGSVIISYFANTGEKETAITGSVIGNSTRASLWNAHEEFDIQAFTQADIQATTRLQGTVIYLSAT
jgi:hypothetical protein